MRLDYQTLVPVPKTIMIKFEIFPAKNLHRFFQQSYLCGASNEKSFKKH